MNALQSSHRGWGGVIESVERKRIARYEAACTGKVGAAIVVTGVDRDKLYSLGAKGRIEVIPFGVDLEKFTMSTPVEYDTDVVSFLGNLHSAPNRDAVRYFVDEIWPLVREGNTGARFRIIGINAPDWIRDLDGKMGVDVVGEVDDVRPYLRGSVCTVCPMRIGAGIQTKNLESMALAVPVVSTPVGFEGLGADDGQGILAANGPKAFADAVAGLMGSPERRDTIGMLGRRFIEKNYDWNDRAEGLSALMRGDT